MSKIAAGIVLYNPEYKRLFENVNAIINQVDFIVLIDNNSTNISQIENMYKENKNIHIIKNSKNLGIATALNQIINFCHQMKSEWVITLDQDSICPKEVIENYKKYLNWENIGIICPTILDRNEDNNFSEENDEMYEFVEECITSGSLINIRKCIEIGKFDEKMFIDLVDFEYCYRLREKGYKILKSNKDILLHQLGEMTIHKFGNKVIKVGNHSTLRKYYYFRNCVYVLKKHKHLKFNIKILKKMFSKIVQVIFFEKERITKLKAIYSGILFGLKM